MNNITIKINFYNNTKYKIPKTYLNKTAKKIIAKAKIIGDFEIDVLFCNLKEITKINKKFRKLDKPTDVLSFPIFNHKYLYRNKDKKKHLLLGELVISPFFLKKQKVNNTTLKNKIIFAFAHGLKHLIGHHHK